MNLSRMFFAATARGTKHRELVVIRIIVGCIKRAVYSR